MAFIYNKRSQHQDWPLEVDFDELDLMVRGDGKMPNIVGLPSTGFCLCVCACACVCMWQVFQKIRTSHPEVSPPTSCSSIHSSTYLPPKLLHCRVLTFILLSRTVMLNCSQKPHAVLFFSFLFLSFFFFVLYVFLFSLLLLCIFGCGLRVCVCMYFKFFLLLCCVRVCVFSSCLRWLRFLCRQMQHLARAA